ncbi:hypothetical protein N5V81_27285 [Escherichia coli]|nr:hypothetical protein [Escherichia coli]
MTNRISRLKTALFANTREISLERALYRQPSINRRRTDDIAPGESNSVYP